MRHHLSLFLLVCLLVASGGITPSVGAAPLPTTAEPPAAQAAAPVAPSYDTSAAQPDTALVPSLSAASAGVLPEDGTAAELNGLLIDPPDVVSDTGATDEELGTDVSPAGDVDDNGYTDVIVGAPAYNTDDGAAYVYYGTASGLATTTPAPTRLEGEASAASRFGTAVSTAGDVNGDGLADVVVGAPGYNTNDGEAYIFLGTGTGIDTNPTLTIDAAFTGNSGEELGTAVGTAGDLDGDGFDDVVIGTTADTIYIVYGQSTMSAATVQAIAHGSSGFGTAVDTAGDVNADGYADIIVGATNLGEAYLYAGQAGSQLDSTATLTLTGAISSFGTRVSAAGDVNGDGYSDVLISEPGNTVAYVYLGGAEPDGTPTLTEATNTLSIGGDGAIGPAGDVDGDGFADILVQSNTDEVTLYRGGPGDETSFTPTELETLTGTSGDGFGNALDTAGDTNGDGYADIIIGAPNAGTNDGAFSVYRGAPGSLANDDTYETIQAIPADNSFGNRAVSAGDLNGDGYSDVAITLWGGTKEIYIYYGGPNGITDDTNYTTSSAANVTLSDVSGDNTDVSPGFSIASAGDVDGDGYEDLLIGDPGKGDGYVYLYCGGENGIAPPYNQVIQGEEDDSQFGWSVGGAGDIDGDGFADIIIGAPYQDINTINDNNGKVFVYYGNQNFCDEAPGTADWMLSTEPPTAQRTTFLLGNKVGTAGDVNGDGYADIIVGATDTTNKDFDEDFAGLAMVYHGSASGLTTESPIIDNPNWVFEGRDRDRVGHSVSTAGDVNGDGFSDVLVTATRYTEPAVPPGDPHSSHVRRVYLFHGSASGLTEPVSAGADESTKNATLRAAFGISAFGREAFYQYDIAHTAGDVNGDGLSDIIVAKSRHFSSFPYGATIYLGSDVTNTGLTNEHADPQITNSPAITLTATKTAFNDLDRMPYSVSSAGDINGDGFADVILGTDRSFVSIYYGNNGQGRQMVPRQLLKGSAKQISYLGTSDSRNEARLSLLGYTPLGGEVPIQLEWEAQAFDPNASPQPDALTDTTAVVTSTQNIPITATVSGLEAGTPYSWRVRLLYPPGNRLGQVASRWYQTPRNAQTEQDFRTKVGATLTATPNNPILGNSTELAATLDVPGATITEYRWTLDTIDPTRLTDVGIVNTLTTNPPENTVTVTYPDLGSYTAEVEIVYTIGGGEPLTLKATATIEVVPDEDSLGATLTTDSPTISGQTTTLTAQPAGLEPKSYVWDFGDGSDILTITDPIIIPDVQTHTYPTAVGIYTPTVTICYDSVDPCDLSRSATAQVEIIDEALDGLDASYTPVQDTYLVGESIQFNASITQGTNPVYTWDFGNGTERTGASVSYAYPEPGSYTVKVTVQNSLGSETFTFATTITVVEQGIVGPLEAFNDSPTFFGETTTLSATITEGTNVYYTWDFGDGEQITTKNSPTGHVYSEVGVFEVTVTVSNSVTAPLGPATTVVTVEDRPIVGLTAGNDSPTLLGSTTTFTASVTEGTNVEYQWDFADGTVTDWTSTPTATHTFAAQGEYVATVRARNSATNEAIPFQTTTATVIGPELSITKAREVGEVEAGEPITFTLTVQNSGTYTATSLIISDQLPADATFVAAPFVEGSETGQLSGGVVTWAVEELAPDASVAVQLVVTAEQSITNDTYSVRTEDQFALNVAGNQGVTVIVSQQSIIYLPIIHSPGPVVEDLPDLVGTFSISPDKTTFGADELVTISGRVTNQGTAPNTDSFWVDLFINPTTPPTADELPTIWNLRCEQPCIGISWAITETLQPGESFTFNSTAESYQSEYTIWEGYFDTNPTSLYLYVDPWASADSPHREQGAVVEVVEDNNLSQMENLTVQGIAPGLSSAPARWLPPRPDLNAQP